jgi:hypothetical protein
VSVAYSSSATASNIPKAADVASAVQKALVDADFKVGAGDDLEPVKSVASVDKFTGNGTAGRRLAESATSGTFRITVVAFAPKLPAISKAVRTPTFGKGVEDALLAAGHTGIATTIGSYSPITVLEGDVMGPLTLEDKPPPEPAGGGLDFVESEAANQAVADDAVPGWGVFLIVLLLLCCLSPFFCGLYAHFKYGAGKETTWFKYKLSHSNPIWPLGYIPGEDRQALWASLYEEKKPAATLDESTAEDKTTPESRI